MKVYFLLMVALLAIRITSFPAMAAPPPQAIVLSKVVSESKATFKAKVVYAQQAGDSYVYGIVLLDTIRGTFSKKCLLSKASLRVSATYLFMLKDVGDTCGNVGDKFLRALEIRSFLKEEIVVFDNDRFIYPAFGKSLFIVKTEPEGGADEFVVWTGVRWKDFKVFLEGKKHAP